MTPPRRGTQGNVGYTAFSKMPQTHRGQNACPDAIPQRLKCRAHVSSRRFTPGSRADVPGYQQLIDNDRVRAWRLVLDPGQSAAAITHAQNGMRIVVDGGEISESVPGAAERGWALIAASSSGRTRV